MPETGTDGYLTPVTRIKQQRNEVGRRLLVTTTVASSFVMINCVLLILLATELADPIIGPRTLSFIALVFQLTSVAVLSWVTWRERRRRTGFAGIFKNTVGQRKRDAAVTGILVGVGQAVTLASLIWIRLDVQDPTYKIHDTSVSASAVLIASWILSLVFEATTFFLVFPQPLNKRSRNPGRRMLDTPTAQPMLPSPTQFESPKLQYAANPFSSVNATPTQSPKTNSMISLHSLTLPRGVGPHRISASIRRSLSINSTPRATPSPRQSGESAFDTWDTSNVPFEMRATLSSSTNLHTTARPLSSRAQTHPRLPPIPGSRPVSPAKPLEGPFPLLDTHLETPDPSDPSLTIPIPPPPIHPADTADLPPSPTVLHHSPPSLIPMPSSSSLRTPFSPIQSQPLSSPASLDSLRSSLTTAPPRPSFARQTSLSSQTSIESFHHLRSIPPHVPQEESQIHPLFRVTSPEPAPATTPGTVVTAVPPETLRASLERARGASISGSLHRPGSRSGARGAVPSPSPLVREVPRAGGVVGLDEGGQRDGGGGGG